MDETVYTEQGSESLNMSNVYRRVRGHTVLRLAVGNDLSIISS